jgi:hypothetical protein
LWEELVEHIEKHKVKILTPCMAIYHYSKGNENYVDAEVIEPISEKIPETLKGAAISKCSLGML